MKIHIQIARNSFLFALLLSTILSIGSIKGQEIPVKEDSLFMEPLPFALSEIPSEYTNLSNRLVETLEIIQPDEKIGANDLVVREFSIALQTSKEEIIRDLPMMSYTRLENLTRAWGNYQSKFGTIQGALKDRINEIATINNELDTELDQWGKIYEVLINEDSPEELQQSADTLIATLHLIRNSTIERTDSLILMRNRLSNLNIFIDDVLRLLENEQQVYQSNYLIIDANPIWSASDSTSNLQHVRSHFKSEFTENYSILKTYLRSNKGIVILQLAFIVLLISGFIIISRIWPTDELDPNSRRETQAGFTVRHPFFSSLLISIIISLFFYTNRPLVLVEFFTVLMMISSLVLLPGLLSNKIKIPLLILLTLFIITVVQDFLPNRSVINRIIIFIQSGATLFLLYTALKIKNEFGLKPFGLRLVTGLTKVFILLMIIAFIANVIGSVKLANFLILATIRTLSFSIIAVTIVIILNSMMILLIKGKRAQSIPLHDQLKNLIDSRIRPLINGSGFVLWMFATLVYFRLLRIFQNWIGRLMDTEFMVASVAISIGGIVSFFLIAFITYLIARFVKNVFKDEWVTKSNWPRGTADASSMLIRYTVVAFGVYLALNALGFNINSFGFMAGALGVGIGFGLQNVVLNFIAGLILAVERPFHVGDVIEVDKYMGRVTEIGVRASKVMTWDGSEVIVPNGSLITGNVVNWTLTNEKRRLVITIKTPMDADPETVIEILTKVAQDHPNTLEQPAAMAIFNGYEGSSLDFTVYCWVEFSVSLATKSEIAIGAVKALSAAGIAAPMPVQKLKIDKNNN